MHVYAILPKGADMFASTSKEVNIGTEVKPVLIDAIVYRLLIEKPDHLFQSIVSGSTSYTDEQLDAMLRFKPEEKPSHV